VPVNARPGQRPEMVEPPTQTAPSPGGAGRYRFPVSDLLRCRPGDRDRRAAQLPAAGGWPGPRRVVVGSLTGGAGRSTTTAVMCAAAVDAGVPVLALDATGGVDGELAARAAGEMDCAQRAVVAVRADRRGVPGAARRALVAAAGPLPVPYVARLAGRRAAAQGPDAVAAGRLLLVAAALTPGAPSSSPEEQ